MEDTQCENLTERNSLYLEYAEPPCCSRDPKFKSSCTLCGKTFLADNLLKRHMLSHESDKPFKCRLCSKQYVNKSQLKRHLLNHNEIVPSMCDVCGKVFTSHKELTNHRLLHTNYKHYKCYYCDKTFNIESSLKVHMQNHSANQMYECPNCGVKFNSSETLSSHCSKDGCKSERFSCDECSFEFTKRMEFLVHMREQHNIEPSNTQSICAICSKTFLFQCHLANHIVNHERSYWCHYCGLTFSDKEPLMKHETGHSTHDAIQCKYCPQRVNTVMELHEHQINHSENPFKCQLCGNILSSDIDLFTHKCTTDSIESLLTQNEPSDILEADERTKVHRTHDRYILNSDKRECSFCGKKFASAFTRRNHEYLHTGEKLHQCEVCGRTFANMSSMTNHKYSHTKPYECEVCGKRFSFKTSFLTHQRVHTGDRPYKCEFCKKSFRQLTALNNHERTHTGERPHPCDICGKSFAQRTALVEHVRRHKNELPHRCSICQKGFMVPSQLAKHMTTHQAGDKKSTRKRKANKNSVVACFTQASFGVNT